jgi:beta-RFAP synthase
MGFFDLHGGLGRKFGSIGLSLAEPALVIQAHASKHINVTGDISVPGTVLAKASAIAQQLITKLDLNEALELYISQHIPEHAGLGSGTQIALAVGSAISNLYQLDLSARKIAELSGRGRRSGIGIAAFDHGGLLIDGGRSIVADAHAVPPLLARYHFPEEWAILLIFDATQPGIHGKQEKLGFNQLPVFPESLAAHLCRHVLMQAMPAMVEKDLTAFGHSIQVLQQHVGDYFAPVQGGRYASKLVGEVLDDLQQAGVACFGQSSWGPTGFAIFENSGKAEQYAQQLKMKFTDQALSWKICKANNHGANLHSAVLTSQQ